MPSWPQSWAHSGRLTRDRFAQLIAPWLDQTITDRRLLELLEHHRQLCAECDEEVRLVQTALGTRG